MYHSKMVLLTVMVKGMHCIQGKSLTDYHGKGDWMLVLVKGIQCVWQRLDGYHNRYICHGKKDTTCVTETGWLS